MRAPTRVPEPPVAPITNGGELATRTLATINPAEQYPRCRVFASMNNRAIVFFAWGAKHVDLVAKCIHESKLPQLPIWLMTDSATAVEKFPRNIKIVRSDFQLSGKARKLELFTQIPQEIEITIARKTCWTRYRDPHCESAARKANSTASLPNRRMARSTMRARYARITRERSRSST